MSQEMLDRLILLPSDAVFALIRYAPVWVPALILVLGLRRRFFQPQQRRQALFLTAVPILALILSLISLVRHFCVDCPISDCWYILRLVERTHNPLILFWDQPGFHREGVGMWLQALVDTFSGYSDAAAAYSIIVLLALSAALALRLIYRLTGNLIVFDSVVPILFLTARQWEELIVGQEIAPCIMPLFLLMLFLLAWLSPDRRWRYSGVLVLNFLTLYSGYGWFIGPATIAVFALDWIRERTRLQAMLLSIAVLSLFSFFIRYDFALTAHNGRYSSSFSQWMAYAAAMLGSYWGIGVIGGSMLGLALLGLIGWTAWRLLHTDESSSRIIFILAAFTLLYVVIGAKGRAGFDLALAGSSRYATLLTPGFLALYLAVRSAPKSKLSLALPALACLICVYFLLPNYAWAASESANFRELKLKWVATYLQTGDYHKADKTIPVPMYLDQDVGHLETMLSYMRARHLSFFAHPQSYLASPNTSRLHTAVRYPAKP